jgi:hypothetical protein
MDPKPEPKFPSPAPATPSAAEPAREALAWIRALANIWEEERERAEGAGSGPGKRPRR